MSESCTWNCRAPMSRELPVASRHGPRAQGWRITFMHVSVSSRSGNQGTPWVCFCSETETPKSRPARYIHRFPWPCLVVIVTVSVMLCHAPCQTNYMSAKSASRSNFIRLPVRSNCQLYQDGESRAPATVRRCVALQPGGGGRLGCPALTAGLCTAVRGPRWRVQLS